MDQLIQAKLRGVHVESAFAFYERLTGRIYTRGLAPSYLVFSEGFRARRLAEATRRVVDVGMSVLALMVIAPLVPLVAAAIKLDSRGPIFYRQARIGRMAVLATSRRQGIGTALLERLVAEARGRGVARVILHAQVHAIGVYRRSGFVAVGSEFEEAGITHQAMERRL